MAEAKATFVGDTGPLEKAAAQLRAKLKADAQAIAKDLTFRPRIDETVVKAAQANISAQLKQWAATPIKGPEIKFDFAKSNAYLDQVYDKLAQQQQAMAARAQRGGAMMAGGGARANIGMAAMQVQDIAVQLQMGTQLSTVIAQQGSQLASILGPSGMIAGGALAVTGLLYNVGKAASDAFDKVITGARTAGSDMDRLAASGSVEQIAAGMDRIKQAAEALPAMRASMGTIGGILSNSIGMFAGGRSRNEQIGDMITAEGLLNEARAKGDLAAVQASDKLLEIAKLRAEGREREAAAMERQAEVAAKIKAIEQSNFGPGAKSMLIENVKQQASFAERKITSDETSAANKKKLEDEERLTKSVMSSKQRLEDMMLSQATGADRLKLLENKAQSMRNDAVLNGYATTEQGALDMVKGGNLKGGEASLRWLQQYRATLMEIDSIASSLKDQAIREAKARDDASKAAERENQAFSDMVDEENSRITQQQADKSTQQARSLTARASTLSDMAASAAINNARAHGHTRKAERMQSRAAYEDKKAQLMGLGMSEQEAARTAQGMQRDEDELAGRRRVIGRAKAPRGANAVDALRAAAQNAGKQAAQAARDNQISLREAGEMISVLRAIETKLNIAR